MSRGLIYSVVHRPAQYGINQAFDLCNRTGILQRQGKFHLTNCALEIGKVLDTKPLKQIPDILNLGCVFQSSPSGESGPYITSRSEIVVKVFVVNGSDRFCNILKALYVCCQYLIILRY